VVYALCAKVTTYPDYDNSSFSEHAATLGWILVFGVPYRARYGCPNGTTPGAPRNFDVRVVAPNGATPISYNRATNSCSLSATITPTSSAPPPAPQKLAFGSEIVRS